MKTAKATVVEETEPYVAVGRTVGSQEVKLTARVVGTLWERNGEEEEREAGREERGVWSEEGRGESGERRGL